VIKERNLYLLVIGVLIVIILFLRSCSPSIPCPDGGKPIITTVTDTVWVKGKDSIIYKPKPYKVVYRDTVEIPKDVDTTAILKDYFAKVAYNDTIKVGKYGYILIKDTISENRIASRQKIDKFEIPEITNTTTVTIPPVYRNQVYIGPEIAGNVLNPINYFGGNILLKTKNDKLYNVGIGVSPGGTTFKIGMGWKIKIK
jgi:hypothetical protein